MPNSPNYQPLAELMPVITANERCTPRHLRAFLDQSFVDAISGHGDTVWSSFWVGAKARALSLVSHGAASHDAPPGPLDISSPAEALAAVEKATLLIGFHPDQATEACIDLAIHLKVPFAVCPCCVFPAEFPDRILPDGRRVAKYPEFIEYLRMKHPMIRLAELPFSGIHRHQIDPDLAAVSPAARSTVLYTLPEDMAST